MDFAMHFVLFLAISTGASAVRTSATESQDLPWRKGAVVGTLLGHTLSGNVIVADVQQGVHTAKTDVFRSAHDVTVGKLVTNLRRSGIIADSNLVENLERSLREAHVQQDVFIEEVVLPVGDVGQIVRVGCVHARDDRSPSDVSSLQHMLWNMARSNSLEDIVLRSIAQSHTPDELAADRNAEVLMMVEPHVATLQSFLHDEEPGFEQLVRFFVEAYFAVQQLYSRQIPHTSNFAAGNVFIKGNLAKPSTLRVVLSPSILITQSALRPDELFLEDIRHLGGLLRSMFDQTWSESTKPKADVLMAFGKAMQSGALQDGGIDEFKSLVEHVLSEETSKSDLMAWRIDLLHRAVGAEKGVQTEEPEPKLVAA